jgi:hypothetical protein
VRDTDISPSASRDASRDMRVADTRAGTRKTTPPLVAAHVDLRDFPFMPLDVRRLRDSDLAATSSSDAFRAAVLLWCASWHQIPAASLPDDDAILANLAGYGRGDAALAAWQAVRTVALRGFVLASDGRHYHPVIAEKALDAWQRKESMAAARLSHAERMKSYRSRRRAGDDTEQSRDTHVTHHADTAREDHTTVAGDGGVRSLIGQGQGQGQREENKNISVDEVDGASPEKIAAKPSRYSDAFLAFWAAYPRKVGKDAALTAWRAAKKRHGVGAVELIQTAAVRLAAEMTGRDLTYCPHPATWLNQGRFADPQTEAPLVRWSDRPQNKMPSVAGG